MTDQQQPTLLWELMQDAYMSAAIAPGRHANECYAAEIEALAQWLVPEEPEPPCGEGEPWPAAYQAMSDAKWEQRQQIRQRLLDEARRCRGD